MKEIKDSYNKKIKGSYNRKNSVGEISGDFVQGNKKIYNGPVIQTDNPEVAKLFLAQYGSERLSSKEQEIINATISADNPSTKEGSALNESNSEQSPAPVNGEKVSRNSNETSKQRREAINADLSTDNRSTEEGSALNESNLEQSPAPVAGEKESESTNETTETVAGYLKSAVNLLEEDAKNKEKVNSDAQKSSASNDKSQAVDKNSKDKLDAFGNLDNADKLYQSMVDISKGLKIWAENLTAWLGNKVKIGKFILDCSDKDLDKVVEVGKRLDSIVREYKAKYDAEKDQSKRSEIFKDYINTLDNLYKELEWKKQTPCEFFFEYKLIPDINKNGGNKSVPAVKEPLLFFERVDKATGNNIGEYALYVTFPEWNGETKNSNAYLNSEVIIEYKSEKFKICEDGASDKITEYTDDFLKEKWSAFYSAKRISENYKQYRNGDRRVEIHRCVSKNTGSNIYGKIILRDIKTGNEYKKYYFFVNLSFRKRIIYQLVCNQVNNPDGDNVEEAQFKLNKINILYGKFNRKIEVVIKHRSEAYDKPIAEVTLDSKVRNYKISVCKWYEKETFNNIYDLYLTFKNPEDEKFYLLEQLAYNHKEKAKRKDIHKQVTEDDLVCPFCHKKIEFSDSNAAKQYLSGGGVSCKGEHKITVYDVNGERQNCLYCDDDVNNIAEYNRNLPDDFLNSDSFRVAVIGAPRSGKSFFLARMFQMSENEIALYNTPLHKYYYGNALGNRNDTAKLIESVGIKVLEQRQNSANNQYNISRNNWGGDSYQDLVWDVNATGDKLQCPPPTTTNVVQDGKIEEVEKRPMLLKFNKATKVLKRSRGQYVFIYDTPGERVYSKQSKGNKFKDFPLLDNPGRLGCIFMYDGDLDNSDSARDLQEKQHKALDALIERLKKYKREHTDSKGNTSYKPIPLAVVLTKFDKYEPEFDSSAHCLRGDIYDMADFKVGRYKRLKYIGTALQNNVDMASEEIRHFIDTEFNDSGRDNFFNMLIENQDLFSEIKFFGISSLGIKESLTHDNTNGIETNRLNFLAEPKRIELPFIWLLNQFGIVD